MKKTTIMTTTHKGTPITTTHEGTPITTTCRGKLRKEELADLLGVPQSAQIYVFIPVGSESGESLDIQDAPIHVEWVETYTYWKYH